MYEVTRRKMLKMAAATALSNYRVQDMRILDPHVHVWKHDARFPFAPGAKVPDFDATPEMLLELMKANGVAKTVIIQVIHVVSK
jgi:L-fuconolactonase